MINEGTPLQASESLHYTGEILEEPPTTPELRYGIQHLWCYGKHTGQRIKRPDLVTI